MEVSWNRGTPKSSMWRVFPWNKPSSYWGTSIYGKPHINIMMFQLWSCGTLAPWHRSEVKHFCSPGDCRITAQRSPGLEEVKIWLVNLVSFDSRPLRISYWDNKVLSIWSHCVSWSYASYQKKSVSLLTRCGGETDFECRGRRSWRICLCSPSSRSSWFPQSWAKSSQLLILNLPTGIPNDPMIAWQFITWTPRLRSTNPPCWQSTEITQSLRRGAWRDGWRTMPGHHAEVVWRLDGTSRNLFWRIRRLMVSNWFKYLHDFNNMFYIPVFHPVYGTMIPGTSI